MKIIILFLCISVSQLFARVSAQQVTLQVKNATFQEIVKELEYQTGLTFLYHVQKVNQLKRISLDCTETEVTEVLGECLKGTELSYKIVENTVVITPAITVPAFAPEKVVLKGKVTDKKGESLPGVAIMIKGTSLGGTTDVDGNFELSVPVVKDLILVFTFVGMKPQEVAYKGQQTLHVVLEAQPTEMDEVVVTGIFTKSKSNFTGAATSFTREQLQQVSSQNLLTTLSVIDPSFKLMENIEAGSNPNNLPEFEIRGSSLYSRPGK